MAAKKKKAAETEVAEPKAILTDLDGTAIAAVVSALVTRIAHQDFISDQRLVDLNDAMLIALGMDPVTVDDDEADD